MLWRLVPAADVGKQDPLSVPAMSVHRIDELPGAEPLHRRRVAWAGVYSKGLRGLCTRLAHRGPEDRGASRTHRRCTRVAITSSRSHRKPSNTAGAPYGSATCATKLI